MIVTQDLYNRYNIVMEGKKKLGGDCYLYGSKPVRVGLEVEKCFEECIRIKEEECLAENK